MYGKYSKSIPQKTFIILAETFILWASYYILFQGGFERLAAVFHWDLTSGDLTHRIVLFVFNCIVYARMWTTMAYLLKREIPWEEAISVPLAFALYYIGYACLGYRTTQSLDWFDGLGIILFVIGSILNTVSEFQRDDWKKNPEHKGKIYTEGLFRYSIHINFFGDWIWVIGYAILTRNIYAVAIPVLLFSLFAFYNIPKLDQYLAERYGQQFTEYYRNTKKFIPFIY